MRFFFSGCLLLWCSMSYSMDIQRWQTPQGSEVWLVERHDLPIVDYSVIFKGAGSTADPENKPSVATATAQLLTTGTADLDEEQFNAKINHLAAEIGGLSGFEYSYVGFRSLSEPKRLNETADLFNQVITRPRFDQTALQRTKDQAILALKQSESYPSFLATRALTRLNYPQHPYGKSAYQTAEKIQAIQREDLIHFHRQYYTQNQAMIAIVGDITRPQAEALIARTLANLPTHSQEKITAPPVPIHGGQRQHIPFAHSTQTTIQIGLPVLKAQDEDYFAMLVGNYILGGGGFDSRLMKTLRDKHGYTYGANSSMAAYQQAAPFTISFSTEHQNAEAALALAQKVLADFVAQGPTEAELKQAKAFLTGNFPLNFDNNGKLLSNLVSMAVHQRPNNWFDDYTKKINALTTQDIKNAWQRKIQPKQMNIVTVGK